MKAIRFQQDALRNDLQTRHVIMLFLLSPPLPPLVLHHHRLDRFVVPFPRRRTSNATRFAHLHWPMPQLRRFDSRHSNVTRRARHLTSRALARDHILPDLGFTVYRIFQDSFVRFLPLFRLEPLLCLFFLPFLLSHRTRDDTTPFTRGSVLVYNQHRWPLPGE